MSKLRVALAYGADAVYVGAAGFSMRPEEASLSVEDIDQAVRLCRQAGRKLYVGVNSLLFPDDLKPVRNWLAATAEIPFDAIIIADPGCFSIVREMRPDLKIHISTQLSTANSEAAKFWASAGADRVVLARECTIEDAKQIATQSGVGVEIFVHGAMCVAVSGRCLLSAFLSGKNASQGECKHSCRWNWQLVEEKRPGETIPVFETGRETIFLGSKDLCLLEHLPLLVESGIASLKVEGRMKGEYYVGVVTRIYRAALDALAADGENYQPDPAWLEELETVTHRPYSTGFAFGYPTENPESLQTNVTLGGTYNVVGIVQPDTSNKKDRVIKILVKRPFAIGDSIEWIGPAMTGGKITIENIQNAAGEKLLKTHPGNIVTVEIKESARNIPGLALLRCKA